MKRRNALRVAGTAIAVATGASVVTAGGDADPRPEPRGGTLPNDNVPTVSTGALGGPPFYERSDLPVGHWIRHDNGWGGIPDLESARRFANNTVQRFIIDGEVFVLDEFDDWKHWVESGGVHHLTFEYVTPPKRKGKTYEIRWEFESDQFDYPFFPNTNQVEIVGRN